MTFIQVRHQDTLSFGDGAIFTADELAILSHLIYLMERQLILQERRRGFSCRLWSVIITRTG